MRGAKREIANDQISEIFDQVKSELQQAKRIKRSEDQYQGIELSPGFIDQMHDLEKIRKKNPGQVFPFLAVDPRRLGILELIQMKVNKEKGPFFGIKLYTPLGYLPTHPSLAPIFKYCEDEAIPITAHTSLGGVKNFCNKIYVSSKEPGYGKYFSKVNKSKLFADPDNWIPVLEQWKELHLNLAHFGGGDRFTSPHNDWREKITKLLKNPQYPNVFTDISYFTKESSAADVTNFLIKNPDLKKRLLFGTDFVMIALDRKLGGLHQYFSNFDGMVNEILYQNAIDFLAAPAVTSAQKKISVKGNANPRR